MRLYHGTSKENSEKIIKSRRLGLPKRKLYLSLEYVYAKMHGDIIFVVDYNPSSNEMKVETLTDGTPVIQVVTDNIIQLDEEKINGLYFNKDDSEYYCHLCDKKIIYCICSQNTGSGKQ